MKIRMLAFVLTAALLTTGCSTLKQKLTALPSMPSAFKVGEKKEVGDEESAAEPIVYGQPVKMLAIWKDSVRTELGKPAMRGFGGRIFLYDADGQPIRAKGDLVIYGFDDSVKDRTGSKADHKEVFENEIFQARFSPSALGESYSVWIDWDEVGSPEKSVTLIPFFKAENGEIVQTGQSVYTLHSKTEKELFKEFLAGSKEVLNSGVAQAGFDGDGNSEDGVQKASFEDSSDNSQAYNSVKTTTIRMPKSTQLRVKNGKTFNRPENDDVNSGSKSFTREKATSSQAARIREAREKRHEELREKLDQSRVYGRPGTL